MSPPPRFAFAVKTRWFQLHVHSDEGMPLFTCRARSHGGPFWLSIGFLCVDLGWIWASAPAMLDCKNKRAPARLEPREGSRLKVLWETRTVNEYIYIFFFALDSAFWLPLSSSSQ